MTSAKVNGVKLEVSHEKVSPSNATPKTRAIAMPLYTKSDHKRAAKVLGFAATVGTSDAWLGASAVWAARLSVPERVSLAYAALKALDEDAAYLTASVALFGVLDGEVLA